MASLLVVGPESGVMVMLDLLSMTAGGDVSTSQAVQMVAGGAGSFFLRSQLMSSTPLCVQQRPLGF
jgi:hypothetical protein